MENGLQAIICTRISVEQASTIFSKIKIIFYSQISKMAKEEFKKKNSKSNKKKKIIKKIIKKSKKKRKKKNNN